MQEDGSARMGWGREVQVGCRDQGGMRGRGGGVTCWGSLALVGTHLGVVSEIWDKGGNRKEKRGKRKDEKRRIKAETRKRRGKTQEK